MWRIVRVMSVLGLCACVPTPAPSPVDLTPACGADALGAFGGQPLAAVQAQGLPPGARIIRPGDMVTEDFSTSRLNVDLDANDRVTRLWCG
jgi:Peptidase inhibitor I78 family